MSNSRRFRRAARHGSLRPAVDLQDGAARLDPVERRSLVLWDREVVGERAAYWTLLSYSCHGEPWPDWAVEPLVSNLRGMNAFRGFGSMQLIAQGARNELLRLKERRGVDSAADRLVDELDAENAGLMNEMNEADGLLDESHKAAFFDEGKEPSFGEATVSTAVERLASPPGPPLPRALTKVASKEWLQEKLAAPARACQIVAREGREDRLAAGVAASVLCPVDRNADVWAAALVEVIAEDAPMAVLMLAGLMSEYQPAPPVVRALNQLVPAAKRIAGGQATDVMVLADTVATRVPEVLSAGDRRLADTLVAWNDGAQVDLAAVAGDDGWARAYCAVALFMVACAFDAATAGPLDLHEAARRVLGQWNTLAEAFA